MSVTENKNHVRVREGIAVQVAAPGQDLKAQLKKFDSPKGNEILIKVLACGICHSDSFPLHGGFHGQKYPVAPGHEIVGIVEETGPDSHRFKQGERVGIGWHGGHCGHCNSCLRADYITCSATQIPGITTDGGYSQYAIFSESACAKIPDGMDSFEAAPLMCAGVTTFNALRHSGARAGDLVAVVGIGGLGHLGVQYAAKMGFRTVAVARGSDKEKFSKELGALEYIDSKKQDVAKTLMQMGGAKVILTTVINADSMSECVDGLGLDGKLLIVGASMEAIKVTPIQLIGQRRSISGWASGTAMDSQDCLNFSKQCGIKPLIEKYPLKNASKAYERMMSGEARFRVVLDCSDI